MATFINREKEVAFLNHWLKEEPNAILFMYGPKSGGKSTLIDKVIQPLAKNKKFAINYIDLRRVLVYNFKTFLDVFFQKDTKGKVQDIIEGLTVNIGFFSLKANDDAIFKTNPFKTMEEQLQKAVARGIKPVIIIDELQTLKNIYVNGERFLIDELFNLFIALTKTAHLAHIILLTSDSYFVEEIYNNAKLNMTTQLYHVGHLEKEAVTKWLTTENLPKDDIQIVWKKIGGNAWEIANLLREMKRGGKAEDICDTFITDQYGKLTHFIRTKFSKEEKVLIKEVHKKIVQNDFAQIEDFKNHIDELIPKMVAHDFWYFQVEQQKITANSESIRGAMKKMI